MSTSIYRGQFQIQKLCSTHFVSVAHYYDCISFTITFLLFFLTAHRLSDLLMFSLANQIPSLWFQSPDKITALVLENECGPLPNANTCPQELELPSMHENFEDIQGSGSDIV